MDSCIECKKTNCFLVNENEGCIVCTDCGRVNVTGMIDDTAEWRYVEDGDGVDPCRVGMPNNELLSDKGLGTVISDITLNRWGQRSQLSNLDSALLKSFTEISEVCNNLCLSKLISERSKKLFKHIYLKKLTRGKSHMGIICACIFISCRKSRNNCSVYEIAQECCVDKIKLYKAYVFVREYIADVFPLTSAQILAKKYAETFGFNEELIKKVEHLVEEIDEFNKHNETDEIIATLGVFLIDSALGCKRGLKIFLDAFRVDENSIKTVYRKMFAIRFKLMENLASYWQIANLPNL
jgi:transcription initiation factor TFIIIB Brf1 subunit/transcription initiation factor TFIIB